MTLREPCAGCWSVTDLRVKVLSARSHRGSWSGRMAARLEPGAAGQLACSDIRYRGMRARVAQAFLSVGFSLLKPCAT
eukprot:5779116-Prymnesium_polylepis.1